ncbi:MAG: class I SAM-dependent methyltransferase [Acidiferrobacterales bacterium]|nr:class I SAM-dependent methyltransferase [Acidiferrobacterales bacterium]
MANQVRQIAESCGSEAVKALKARQKATWEDGDYARFAKYMEEGAIDIVSNWQLTPGQRLLDVACGSGQSALPAARLGLKVTGIDIAHNLIDGANQRARDEGLDARFDQGDAESLPFEDASFDTLISMIGAMFAPRPDRVASEFARVLRPGGTLYMCNWTPRSMPAQMFKAVAKRVPPPPGAISPMLWGDESIVSQRLSEHFTEVKFRRKLYPRWHFPSSIDELVVLFRTTFGPVKRAFEAVDAAGKQALRSDLRDIYVANSRPDGESGITLQAEYLEVIATRR